MPQAYAQEAPTMQIRETASNGSSNGLGAPSDMAMAFSEAVPVKMEGPTIVPATETRAAASADEQGVSAWHNSKKVTALWCNASDRNAYASVEGVGWRRLSNANDGAHLSLAMLAAHAEQTGSNCNVQIESDNMIHEIYVW